MTGYKIIVKEEITDRALLEYIAYLKESLTIEKNELSPCRKKLVLLVSTYSWTAHETVLGSLTREYDGLQVLGGGIVNFEFQILKDEND